MINTEKIKEQIYEFQRKIDIKFPEPYFTFLSTISIGSVYEIENSGIFFYSLSDLKERNDTYEIEKYDPNYFMIGQEGDTGYFINAKNNQNNAIYSLGLGAIGSLPMRKRANNIQEFIVKITDEKK